MNEEKVKAIAEALAGLKMYEWETVRRVVDRKYTDQERRLVIEDASEIERGILCDM